MSEGMSNTTDSTQTNLESYINQVEFEQGVYYGIDAGQFQAETTKAAKLADDMGSLPGSIENGDGNYAGFVAELILGDILNAQRDATYNYDLKMPLYGGVKIDVKTKRRTVPPKSHYEVSIADWNTSQECDWYYFTSFDEQRGMVWLLGYLKPERYYELATFHEEGEKDPDNGFVFKADCYNVEFSKLKQAKETAPLISSKAATVRV